MTKNTFDKLSYHVRGPFHTFRSYRRGSCFVQKLYKLDSPELKFMAPDLYPLHLLLNSCEPVDSFDTLYLNEFYYLNIE